jgi:hypothetical protein
LPMRPKVTGVQTCALPIYGGQLCGMVHKTHRLAREG